MSSFVPQISRVKGISDKRRLPRLGKIRLGVKVPVNGKPGKFYPKDVDYFVCPQEVIRVFGEKPQKLEIMFPLNELEAIFPQALTWYGASKGVKCKGDNEVAYRHKDACDGDCHAHTADMWHERTCPCDKLKSDTNPKGECSLRGHLLFMIPKVSMGGVYQLDTGSYNSTVDLNSGVDYIRQILMLATEGKTDRFALLPITLERVPRKTSGGESGVQQTHYTLRLTCNLTLDELAARRKDPGILQVQEKLKQLALPEIVDENPELDAEGVIEHEQEQQQGPLGPINPPVEVTNYKDAATAIINAGPGVTPLKLVSPNGTEAPPLTQEPPPDDGAPPYVPEGEELPKAAEEPEPQPVKQEEMAELATKQQIDVICSQMKKKKITAETYKAQFTFPVSSTPKDMVNTVLDWIRQYSQQYDTRT